MDDESFQRLTVHSLVTWQLETAFRISVDLRDYIKGNRHLQRDNDRLSIGTRCGMKVNGSSMDDELCFRAWRGCYADIQLPTTETVFLSEWSDETFARTCSNISHIVECSEKVEKCERYRKKMNLAIDRAMVWVCNEGYSDFTKNRECFKNNTDGITEKTSRCSNVLDENLKAIKKSKQHNVEMVNEICRELNKTMDCYVRGVAELCGESGSKWFKMINENLIKEHSTFLRCSEINPGDTTVTKLVFAAILLCVLIVPALILVCLIMYRKRKLRLARSTSTINAPRSTRSSPLSHTRQSNRGSHQGNDSRPPHHHHSSFKQNPNNNSSSSQRHLKSRYQRQTSDRPSDAQNSTAPLLHSAKGSKDEEVISLEMKPIPQLNSPTEGKPPTENQPQTEEKKSPSAVVAAADGAAAADGEIKEFPKGQESTETCEQSGEEIIETERV